MNATIMEININNFLYNVKQIQDYVGNKTIMPIIKANAYGTYINTRLDIINNFDIVCVARVSEGIELRNLGYKKEILIVNQPYIKELEEIVKYNLTFALSEENFLNEMIKSNKKYNVHLELETGMNRTGIKIHELDSFIDKIKSYKNINVEGVFTHLSSADYDHNYTKKQLDLFKSGVDIVSDSFKLKYIHSCASNGLINYNDTLSNAVRPGIILYGYESFKGANKIIDIKPVTKLKTRIIFIKDINRKESVSYSRNFISRKKMRIATIPIGYADGLRRALSNKGYVIVNGKKCKIIGSICMDSAMIDVTECDANINDEVYIWDNDNQTIDDIAKLCKTINYEILSTISPRVERIFIKNKIK
jgi:alanine racemase